MFSSVTKSLFVEHGTIGTLNTNGQVVMEEEPIVVGPNQETTPVILTIIIAIVFVLIVL